MRGERQAVRACLHRVSESESLCATECFVTSDVIGRQEVLREQELAVLGRFGVRTDYSDLCQLYADVIRRDSRTAVTILYARVLHWLERKHVIIQNKCVLVVMSWSHEEHSYNQICMGAEITNMV